MEREEQLQDPKTEQDYPESERRSATQAVYTGEERRKADSQLDQMANGQQDG